MSQQAFFEAVLAGEAGRVQSLLRESPELVRAIQPTSDDPADLGGCTGLHLAARRGHLEVARVLLEAGAEIDARNGEGRTALHDAIEHGHGPVEELLLARGAEVDGCAAAILGHLERLQALLDHDPGIANERTTGLSPLGWASFGNQVETARLLLDRGARLDDGELLCAASVGHVEVGRLLLEHGADPDAFFGEAGANALHAAAGMRYTADSSAFVTMLLEAGVDTSLPTRDGKTALRIAEEGARRQAEQGSQDQKRNYEGVARLLRAAVASG